MPDPQAELKRMVEELRAISKVLDATPTPALARPDVPYKQVTEELVHWAIRVYAYSILCQFREMLRSTLIMFDSDQTPPVFLCARAMWEMSAHSYYVKKHCFQYMDKKDWQATWGFMLGINEGSRYMKERQDQPGTVANAGAAIIEELPEGPHIGRVMACFNEYFRSDEDKEPKRATEEYSFLSEFCHPNSFAFTNHIDMDKAATRGAEVKVEFVKPDKQSCIQVMPNILYGCMPLLFSMDELLTRIGDNGFSNPAREYAKIAGPAEPDQNSKN